MRIGSFWCWSLWWISIKLIHFSVCGILNISHFQFSFAGAITCWIGMQLYFVVKLLKVRNFCNSFFLCSKKKNKKVDYLTFPAIPTAFNFQNVFGYHHILNHYTIFFKSQSFNWLHNKNFVGVHPECASFAMVEPLFLSIWLLNFHCVGFRSMVL